MAEELYREITCRYFARPGEENTKAALEAAAHRARELSIKTVLVASCSGKTALAARKIIGGDVRLWSVTPCIKVPLTGAGYVEL